jgi:hypothetical protein
VSVRDDGDARVRHLAFVALAAQLLDRLAQVGQAV